MNKVRFSTKDKNRALPTSPHYTDPRFKKPQLLFGAECDGLEWEYSDRLQSWDSDSWKRGYEIASWLCDLGHFVKKSALYYECVLSVYYRQDITVKCIVSGINKSNGYPWNCFGFTRPDA